MVPCHAGIRYSICFPPFSPPKHAKGLPQIPNNLFQRVLAASGMAHNRNVGKHSRRNGPMIPF
jgi:hypothetical protein